MKRRLMQFMSGRYGTDQLSKFLLGVCLVCIVLNLVTGWQVLYLLSTVLIAVCYARMLSRNYAKRSAENQKYLQAVWKLKNKTDRMKYRMAQRKEFHIYKCPSCSQKIRIPRGKGKICITCPKCKTEFQKKS